jgi:hypothetical protein
MASNENGKSAETNNNNDDDGNNNINNNDKPRRILKKSDQTITTIMNAMTAEEDSIVVVDAAEITNKNNNNNRFAPLQNSASLWSDDNNNNNDSSNNNDDSGCGVDDDDDDENEFDNSQKNNKVGSNSSDKKRNSQKPTTINNKLQRTASSTENKKEKGGEIPIFTLMNGEAPFLVGVKGRNISLIRKFSGMAIYIRDDKVSMVPQRFNANTDLAQRMVLSACYGGILRWFDTPAATKRGYPEERISEMEKLAGTFDMCIDLLRSKRGHMCLMLIPQPADNIMLSIETVKAKISAARIALLEALSPSTPATIVD